MSTTAMPTIAEAASRGFKAVVTRLHDGQRRAREFPRAGDALRALLPVMEADDPDLDRAGATLALLAGEPWQAAGVEYEIISPFSIRWAAA